MTPTGTSSDHMHISARVSALEEAVSNIHADVAEVKAAMTLGFRDLTSKLDKRSETNWGTIFAGVGVVILLYGAAIYPIQDKMAEQQRLNASFVSNMQQIMDRQTDARVKEQVNDAKTAELADRLDIIRREGSPITDRRLSIIESKLGLPVQSEK